PSIYQSVTTNTSKEMTSYSDYPFPDLFPNFLHNSKIMDYVRMYAKHFDLLKYIHFSSKVISIKKRSDFSSNGQWNVVVETDGKQESYVFDGIMVCSGHYSDPYLPLECFPGIKKFTGLYFHSHEYKNPEKFKGKRILVVGIGNTGADVASELSHVAKQVCFFKILFFNPTSVIHASYETFCIKFFSQCFGYLNIDHHFSSDHIGTKKRGISLSKIILVFNYALPLKLE
uniref:Flavin-containing monooxygenase n=1 Tax=Monodelphis domestica TaxID=13616 RepID=F6XDV0_MONDO